MSHAVEAASVEEGRKKEKRRRLFLFISALARHGSSCLWDGGRNLFLRTDMIWKSINIISKTLPRRSIFALWDMKPGLFSLRWGDVMLWEQFGCSPAPPCRLEIKLSFIYYSVCKQKKKRQKYMYVHDLRSKCDLFHCPKFLFDLFLSAANWTVRNVNRKHGIWSCVIWFSPKIFSYSNWSQAVWSALYFKWHHGPDNVFFILLLLVGINDIIEWDPTTV